VQGTAVLPLTLVVAATFGSCASLTKSSFDTWTLKTPSGHLASP
jgi:hypothetical protein